MTNGAGTGIAGSTYSKFVSLNSIRLKVRLTELITSFSDPDRIILQSPIVSCDFSERGLVLMRFSNIQTVETSLTVVSMGITQSRITITNTKSGIAKYFKPLTQSFSSYFWSLSFPACLSRRYRHWQFYCSTSRNCLPSRFGRYWSRRFQIWCR